MSNRQGRTDEGWGRFHISVTKPPYERVGCEMGNRRAPTSPREGVEKMEFSAAGSERSTSSPALHAPVVKASAGELVNAPTKIAARDVNVFYGEKQALFD